MADYATIINPPNGVLEITDVTGSIFDKYYVSGSVAATGIIKGGVEAYCYNYKFTINDYEQGKRLIDKNLDYIQISDLDEECKNLLYQQQFVSVISLMEHFLSCSFVGHICNHEESYHKVLDSELLQKKYGYKAILNGEDCIDKELLFIDLANRIVYHNKKDVNHLFEAAFGINVDLCPLESLLSIRHDITHRFGYSKSALGGKVNVTYDEVKSLIEKVDDIVSATVSQLPSLPSYIPDLSVIDDLLI